MVSDSPHRSRRRFVQNLALTGVAGSLGLWRNAQSADDRGTVRQPVRSVHRCDRREPRRPPPHGDGRQRPTACAHVALARRRHRYRPRSQHIVEDQFDSLARHSAAGGHGRRAGFQFRRHRAGRDVHVSLSGAAIGHVLVSQPFAISGTDRAVRRARDRTARRRAACGRSRLRDPAVRLDGRRSRTHLFEPEKTKRLLQLRAAHGCGFRARRTRGWNARSDRSAQHVESHAHGSERSQRCFRLRVHISDEWRTAGNELDGAVFARRKNPAAVHQRFVDDDFRCAHSGIVDDGRRRRRTRHRAGRRR